MASVEITEHAEELLGEMLDLHEEGLARIIASIPEATTLALARDPVVGSMLLVHGLHPVSLEERVGRALDRVRPYLASHRGDVELVGIDDGVVHLRLLGSCDGCASSSATLELAIEGALEEDAPDLLGVEVEGVGEEAVQRAPSKLLPIWSRVDVAPEPGEVVLARRGLVVANVAGTLLAYRDACAGCGSPLAGGALDDGVLACPDCGRRYALTLAGRLVGQEELQLEPVPLLEDEHGVQVAV
jgi:Fe-S cluster biogenesis protein NfuA/nitrite reductase/ring-hydroxylating ferredoxin subunit